jgi:hypothetical protein
MASVPVPATTLAFQQRISSALHALSVSRIKRSDCFDLIGAGTYSSSDRTMKVGILRSISADGPMAHTGCHTGDLSPGIGLASNSFLHWRAVHRAHFFDFFLRALSVEIPVPAYICR